ncbi:hypothetical protein [Paraburkholderia solisilvae]|uniref:Uncharacterized protein n=1 Tax=Paraburkholderia solisilvae TaxID=624376 RepID=A0A6J5EU65_9BURK|nr:hypothetical protein [Paraburkholderia solisilvae]CAB3768535.1 hypothetical protein LMG29739_05327 [Paraburkholderia solisilvae]
MSRTSTSPSPHARQQPRASSRMRASGPVNTMDEPGGPEAPPDSVDAEEIARAAPESTRDEKGRGETARDDEHRPDSAARRQPGQRDSEPHDDIDPDFKPPMAHDEDGRHG